jgi:hypothetical protein
MTFRTAVRQETQVRNSEVYNDLLTPGVAIETGSSDLESDLNALRSQVHLLLNVQSSNWYADLNVPTALDTGTRRGVNNLNTDLHAVERKRILRDRTSLADITVPAGQNFVVLGTGELPAQLTAAVGAVTTNGTVVAAHSGTFATFSLDEVTDTPLNPKNLATVVDGANRDPILSAGRQIYALLQSESAVDGHTIDINTPDRVQLSFVRSNAAGDDFEAVPVGDIQGLTINYTYRERVAFEDLTETDFLRGAIVDVPAGAVVTRQASYDGQGTTPVDLTSNAILDLEGSGLVWQIRDDLEAALFTITEGSGSGNTTLAIGQDVDVLDVDSALNNFANAIQVGTSGTRPVNIGINDGVVETASGDLLLKGASELLFDDINQTGSTWAQDGIKLTETTAEWDAFESAFGEVSVLNAIVQASQSGSAGSVRRATVTSNTAADVNVTGAGGSPNIDNQLQDYSALTFSQEVDIYLNGLLLIPGDVDSALVDVYPGDSPSNGDLKFNDRLRATGSNPDVITMILTPGRTN